MSEYPNFTLNNDGRYVYFIHACGQAIRFQDGDSVSDIQGAIDMHTCP